MNLIKCCAMAVVAVVASASVAHAQPKNLPPPNPATQGAIQGDRDRAARMDDERVSRDLSELPAPRDHRGRLLNPGQVINNARDVVKKAGLPCQVTQAALLGVTRDKEDLYEVACQTGPGYILASGGETPTYDCLVLGEQAERMTAEGQKPPPTSTCRLKANQNTLAIITGFAHEAGISCQVDEGSLRGVNAYEVGCANADGYIIEHKPDGSWKNSPCWFLASAPPGNVTCRYSTAAESASAWTNILSGTAAASCTVEKSRQIGIDSQQLTVYEVKCAGSPGFLARVNGSNKAEQVFACSAPEASSLGGGCTLN